MKYINLGCGSIYSKKDEWTNLDFVSHSEHVISHNLLSGIPFPDNTFDLVYHSHVLEHFKKEDGELFLIECFRVLKKGGVIRFAVPDLGNIIHEYLTITSELEKNGNDEIIQEKYEWILLELFDQIVRTENGGNMGKFLVRDTLNILDYIESKIGNEASAYRKWKLNRKIVKKSILEEKTVNNIYSNLKKQIKYLLNISKPVKIVQNNFKEMGEIHQWMYDKYSSQMLLKKTGFDSIKIRSGVDSFIENWEYFELDTINGKLRKPDSLYIEAVKY